MLFGEIIAVYCENHMEHTDTGYRQNAEFLDVKASGTYSYRCALKVKELKTANLRALCKQYYWLWK
jgi:hypothetical protein